MSGSTLAYDKFPKLCQDYAARAGYPPERFGLQLEYLVYRALEKTAARKAYKPGDIRHPDSPVTRWPGPGARRRAKMTRSAEKSEGERSREAQTRAD